MFEKAAGHRCFLLNPLAAICPFVCAAKCHGSGEIKITPSSINNYLQHLARDHKGNPAAGVLSGRLSYLLGGSSPNFSGSNPHPMASLEALDQMRGKLELTEVRCLPRLLGWCAACPGTAALLGSVNPISLQHVRACAVAGLHAGGRRARSGLPGAAQGQGHHRQPGILRR